MPFCRGTLRDSEYNPGNRRRIFIIHNCRACPTAIRLVTWFRANARPLPWRTRPRDPYATLVSELMAQQTQLDRVVPRFEAFMDRFPDLRALAAATEDEVLELWSGLGYYRRARLLHSLAREVAAGSGELPTNRGGARRTARDRPLHRGGGGVHGVRRGGSAHGRQRRPGRGAGARPGRGSADEGRQDRHSGMGSTP